jgi:hypothetical protein
MALSMKFDAGDRDSLASIFAPCAPTGLKSDVVELIGNCAFNQGTDFISNASQV